MYPYEQDIIGDTRVLSIDMILFMEGKVYESYEENLIIDAYSPVLPWTW